MSRFAGDFKQTTYPVSKLDRYPIPHIEDFKSFTKLDLSQAYHLKILLLLVI